MSIATLPFPIIAKFFIFFKFWEIDSWDGWPLYQYTRSLANLTVDGSAYAGLGSHWGAWLSEAPYAYIIPEYWFLRSLSPF